MTELIFDLGRRPHRRTSLPAMWTVDLDQARYCANPDLTAECIKICAAADISAIGERARVSRRRASELTRRTLIPGLRLGSYLQALSFFVLVLVAPDEGGSEAVWLSLSVSYAFILTNYVRPRFARSELLLTYSCAGPTISRRHYASPHSRRRPAVELALRRDDGRFVSPASALSFCS